VAPKWLEIVGESILMKSGSAINLVGANEERIRARNERKILKAAIDVFSRKGFDGTRISEIADRAGLPKGNVYYYFSSKEAIYTEIISRLIDGWDDALSLISADREPAEAIELYVTAKLEYTRSHAAESRFFANEIIRGAQFLSRRNRKHMQGVTNQAVKVVEGWIADGKMRPVDPRHLFVMLWSSTQFYGDFEPLAKDALQVKKLTKSDYETAAKTIVESILNGLI